MKLRLQNTLAAKAYRDLVVYHDDLTGLPNRERYTDRLEWAIRYSQRYNILGAVLHIDLDRFKKVVEALGWANGDRLLRAVAKISAPAYATPTLSPARMSVNSRSCSLAWPATNSPSCSVA
jgi:GGDEF domain-containing protein